MKLGSRYSKSELQSGVYLLIFLLYLKCGYGIECDWSVQRLSCPPYATTDWDCLQTQLNCTNGGEYHCLRDESGEWTEICAKSIKCSKGQEPVLKNSQIVCTNCKNPERYEPVDGTESYKYSECRRIKTSCRRDVSHECPVDETVRYAQNRQCKCDHEKDYMPQNYDLNSDTWICKEPDDLNCIYAPCPEDVYGNAQTRNEKYRCVRLLSPVTLTPNKKPTDRVSPQTVTQKATKPNNETGPADEAAVYPDWVVGLTVGMLVVLSLSLILYLIVYYIKRRYKIGTPVNLTASEIKYCELTLSWEPPQGYLPTHYKLEKREDSSSIWIKTDTISAKKTVYCVSRLKPGTLYNFRVTAKIKRSKSKPVGCQAQTKSITVPNAPLELNGRFDFEAMCIHLRWKQPEDDGGTPIVDYLVQYSSEGEWTDHVSAKANTEWTSSNFTGGVSYNFRVCARNGRGSSIPADLKGKIEYRSIPSEPRDISVTNISRNRLTLNWKPPESDGGDSVTNYLIRQKEDEHDWQQLHEVIANTLSVSIPNLKPDKSYRFGVSAVNRIGESSLKETETAVVARATGRPDTPQKSDKDLQIGSTSAILSWKPPKDDGGLPLLGYVVKEKCLLIWNETLKELEPDITTVSISKLTKDTSYTFLVYAKNDNGKSDPLELKISTKGKTDSEPQKSRSKSETDSTEISPEAKDSEQRNKSETDSIEASSVDKGTSTRPSEINIDVKDSKVIVSWKPPTDASRKKVKEYEVWLKRDLNDWIVNKTVKESKCHAKVKHLNPDINYYFRVCAKFETGDQSDFTETEAPVVLQEEKGKFRRKSLKRKIQDGYQNGTTVLSGAEEPSQSDDVQLTGTNEASSKTTDDTGLPSDKEEISIAERKTDNIQPTNPLTESSNNEVLAGRPNSRMLMKNGTTEEATEATEVTTVKKSTFLKFLPGHFSAETPGPPEDLTVLHVGSRACTLRWKHPKKCGVSCSTCTGYVVKKKESDATEWIEVEELKSEVLTSTIRDLPYNKDIYFSVAAKNSLGIGQAAETDKPLTIKYLLEVPRPVGPVDCSVLTDCSVRLTWRSPNVDASAITGYIIEYTDTKKTIQSWNNAGLVTPETTSFVVKDKLEKKHEYMFRIISLSAERKSQPLNSEKVQIPPDRKGKEGVESKRTDGLTDEADSSATGVDLAETKGDAAESLEKEKKALEMLEILKSIVQWDHFVRHASGIEPLLKDSWIIPSKTVSHLTGTAEYKASSTNLPGSLTAYECPDDGNSLFNSVSLILFGNTSHAFRLRLVAVADGIAKLGFYKKQYFGERNKDGVSQLMKSFFSKTSSSDLALSGKENEDEIRELAIRMAVRETVMPESKCNPLQVQFLSSATGFCIKQHYENQSQDFYGKVNHAAQDVLPYRSRKDGKEPSSKGDSYIHILWVSEPTQKTAGKRVISRVYPVLKKEARPKTL